MGSFHQTDAMNTAMLNAPEASVAAPISAPQDVVRREARAAGRAAVSYSACPYISGQRILSDWTAGFVDRCVETGEVPADTPLYVQGQIAHRQGVSITAAPDGVMAGRWVSGWLMQRDCHPSR